MSLDEWKGGVPVCFILRPNWVVKTTKGESSAQSESCEDQWFQCMDTYIYIYIHVYIYIYTKDDHR